MGKVGPTEPTGGKEKGVLFLSSIYDLPNVADEDMLDTLRYILALQRQPMFSSPIIFEQGDKLDFSLQFNGDEFHYIYTYNESPPSMVLTIIPPEMLTKDKNLLILAQQFLVNSFIGKIVSKGLFKVDDVEANLENQFSQNKVFFSLFSMAALTYKHNESSRYPFSQMKMQNASPQENLGCQYYTENLPLVRHIDLLLKIVEETLPEVENIINTSMQLK